MPVTVILDADTQSEERICNTLKIERGLGIQVRSWVEGWNSCGVWDSAPWGLNNFETQKTKVEVVPCSSSSTAIWHNVCLFIPRNAITKPQGSCSLRCRRRLCEDHLRSICLFQGFKHYMCHALCHQAQGLLNTHNWIRKVPGSR